MTEPATLSSPESSVHRVQRTFAFIDLSGFTRFTEVEGDEAAVEMLGDFRGAVRAVAARRGVRIAKWLGDGAMLVGVEPESLAEAIVDIEDALREIHLALALRAGVATGAVILFEGDDYIGAAVNLASRLCERAEPGEVLAPASMVSSLLVNTEAVPIGAQKISGFTEPIELVRLAPASP